MSAAAPERRLDVPPEALEAQARASEPAASVWVSANAGAGKTTVLAERVVRLLVSGVPARTILCLTYTNAAATEMATRVFGRLGKLATLAEPALAAEVARLAPGADPAAAAARARTLFAEALETPGGLKVQTIHAFSAALLRRFPLEANVAGSFQVLDDTLRDELESRAIATTLARAAEPGSWEAAAVAELVPHVADASFGAALKAALAERRRLLAFAGTEELSQLTGGAPTGIKPPDALAADLAAALDADGDDGTPHLPEDYCHDLVAAIRASGKSEALANAIAEALGCAGEAREPLWRAILLTEKGTPRSVEKFATKAVRDQFPDLPERLAAEAARVLAADDRRRARNAIAATVPLLRLGWAAAERLEAEKRRRGLIDYDDQIEKALALVRAGTDAAWIRYKLDEGIDHVMVDEAQDTSPPQWQLVDALVDEFFSGAGARDTTRTLFVVGDEKQSIYSFQGAAPRLFRDKRLHYARLAEGAGLPFDAVDLAHSFRSGPAVLSAVDRVFADPALAAAVSAPAGTVRHVAIPAGPGGVDVWPLLQDREADTPDDWAEPIDATPENAGKVQLVRAIADQIEAWGREGPDGGPPVSPGDILILARKREPFATLMNRELKARGIPSAGSDRLAVTDHIAVRDMLALARALLTRDDLSLAAVLKSPLFGFTEEELFAVAHGREGSLLAALETGDARARAARETLRRWRRSARRDRPFDVFAGILIAEGRRADFAARMGAEAEDALDALLGLAAQAESDAIPTLETFLHRLEKSTAELRRSAEGGGDAVRVMTVHGAKGLEAEVVFLADVGSSAVPGRNRPALHALPSAGDGDDVLVFAPTKEHRPARLKALDDARKAAELDEHRRLLYVGMTRARRHLVVCGAFGKRSPADDMWHARVCEALASGSSPVVTPAGEGLAWRTDGSAPAETERRRAPPEEPLTVPPWLGRPAVVRRGVPDRLTPSAHAGPGEAAAGDRILPAAEHGRLVHALLERGGTEVEMTGLAVRLHPGLDAAVAAAIAREAAGALALPELRAPLVHLEVDLAGDLLVGGEVRRVTARLDRLQRDGGRATIVDYKTDRLVPHAPALVPASYREQLALYHALVARLLPGTALETAIVWTFAPSFMRMTDVVRRPGEAAA